MIQNKAAFWLNLSLKILFFFFFFLIEKIIQKDAKWDFYAEKSNYRKGIKY